MISRDEILKGQECPADLSSNLDQLLLALNQFRTIYDIPMFVTSGYRTLEHNAAIGGSKNSAHLYCMAADFEDKSRLLRDFCLANIPLLESCGLWMESPDATPTWIHLQIRPAHSRVFIP